MNRFIEWLVSETEPHQQDEFRLRFRRFKQKVNSTEAEELFVRDACEILDQCRDLISPLFESWIGTTSFEEFDLALDNYRRMHSGGYGHSHNSLHEERPKPDAGKCGVREGPSSRDRATRPSPS
jgi:hypothetical protein